VQFINWYIGKLHMAGRHDGALAIAVLEVANLKARPERLLHPAVVARVIWGNLVRRGRGTESAVQAGAGRDRFALSLAPPCKWREPASCLIGGGAIARGGESIVRDLPNRVQT
jgi:hypothetical protein